jgi:type 1 glutamine amidotransferase
MTEPLPRRAHVITGGFPPGAPAGHDHDHARLTLLNLLAQAAVPASVANDFADIGKWLPTSRLLITYVAGPYPDAAQCETMRAWLEAGGHWLAVHGTSGGRAERVEGMRQRRTVKTEHHALLGGFFLTHPPICRIEAEIADPDHPITRGLGASFTVEDEPYFVALQDPANTRILLTAKYGANAISDSVERLYGTDTSLQADGETRVLGYTRAIGAGGVTYFALGHCHSPTSRPGAAADTIPDTFRGAWGSEPFIALLRNSIAWTTK